MQRLLTREVDARPLAVSRILVGLVGIGMSLEWAVPLIRIAGGDVLRVPVVAWTPPPTAFVVVLLFLVTFVGGMGMVLGVFGRAAAIMVAASAGIALLADQQVYSNHALLLVLVATLIAMSGAHRALSILGWLRRRAARRAMRNADAGPPDGRPITERVPYWPAFLIRALLSSVYLWTAIAKVNPDYLAGDVFAHFGNELMQLLEPVLPALAVASILTELFVGIALWVRPLFPLALLAGVGLHVGIVATLNDPYPLVLFAMLMAPAYLLAGAEWVRGGGPLVERTQIAWSRLKRRMPRRRRAASSTAPA